jgi:hypothetical protein
MKMKYFWGYVVGFIFVLLLSSYVVTISKVEEMFETLSTAAPPLYSDKSFVEYHMSEDQIRELNKQSLKVMYIIGKDGELQEIETDTTQNFPIYYTPGFFKYGPRPSVPDYEESVKLSKIELERDIEPLKWSWSADTNKQPEIYNYGKPIDLKPINSEDIPNNGILPTGYFVLNKNKNNKRDQMGLIPEGYYIYDDANNMAQIPPGFQASVDKMYIFRG